VEKKHEKNLPTLQKIMYIIGMKKLSLILALVFLLASFTFAVSPCKDSTGTDRKIYLDCSKCEVKENGDNYYDGEKCGPLGSCVLSCGTSVKGFDKALSKHKSDSTYWANRAKAVGQVQASKEWNEFRKSGKKPK